MAINYNNRVRNICYLCKKPMMANNVNRQCMYSKIVHRHCQAIVTKLKGTKYEKSIPKAIERGNLSSKWGYCQ